MSGLFGSTVIKGTRITEFSETTATVGTTMPFGYGRFTSGGNVTWAPLPPKEHRSVKRQGKGGVKQESFTYSLSYAITFAKGPNAGYWWVKRNGKVVWTQDPNAPVEDKAYAAKWAERATFYLGTDTQLPDSTIESYEGTGQVSAFHGDAYIVVEDDDVTDGGGAVPTYEACVIANGIAYATSPPYPVQVIEHLAVGGNLTDMLARPLLIHVDHDADAALSPQLTGMTLRFPRRDIYADTEHAAVVPSLAAMTLRSAKQTTDTSERAVISPTLPAMTLRRARLDAAQPIENATVVPSLTGMSLYVK